MLLELNTDITRRKQDCWLEERALRLAVWLPNGRAEVEGTSFLRGASGRFWCAIASHAAGR